MNAAGNKDWLLSGGESGGWISQVCGRKDQIVRVERTPFAGDGEIVRRAADEFVSAIKFPDEVGGTEPGDDFNFILCKP